MKTKIPTIAFFFLALGAIFRMAHWPGVGFTMLASALFMIISTMIEFTELEKDAKNRGLQILMSLMLITCTLGAIFKIFHWPGASFIIIVAFILSFIAAVFYFFIGNKDYRLSRNLVSCIFNILLLLMVFYRSNLFDDKSQEAHLENIEHQNTPNDAAR